MEEHEDEMSKSAGNDMRNMLLKDLEELKCVIVKDEENQPNGWGIKIWGHSSDEIEIFTKAVVYKIARDGQKLYSLEVHKRGDMEYDVSYVYTNGITV